MTDTISSEAGAVAALRTLAAAQGLKLRRCGERDGAPTYNILENGERIDVGLNLEEVFGVLSDLEDDVDTEVTDTTTTPLPEATVEVADVVIGEVVDDVIDVADFDVTVAAAGLGELAAIANKWHAHAQGAYLDGAWHSGSALLAAKDQLSHGEFLPWVSVNFFGSRQTAAEYMRIAAAGDSPANVVRALHLEDTPQPSIRAVTKAIAARDAASKPGKRPDTAAKKQKTVRTTALKKVRAAADYVRTEAVKALGTMTRADADDYAAELQSYLDVLDQYYDKVNAISKADQIAQIMPLHSGEDELS